MHIFPAIDIIGGEAVRLIRGDYGQKTVYNTDPLAVAKGFAQAGARYLHTVDLEGARDGGTPNFDTIKRLIKESGLLVEVGGGIRNMETVRRYMDAGVFRVILGTAAVTDPDFLDAALAAYGEKIAVGVDIRDGFVAIKGWRELSSLSCTEFCKMLEGKGVQTVICTDISKDGLLGGTNLALYAGLSRTFKIDFIASGGVSSLSDIQKLAEMGIYGAIVGKAIYEKTLDLKDALRLSEEASV